MRKCVGKLNMFCGLHHFVCSVHFPTVQKHTGFETIPHLYWENDKGVKPANGFQPAFSGHSVGCQGVSWSEELDGKELRGALMASAI